MIRWDFSKIRIFHDKKTSSFFPEPAGYFGWGQQDGLIMAPFPEVSCSHDLWMPENTPAEF